MELGQIEADQIGFNASSPGPFGLRRIVYGDYTASGRALKSIEDYISNEVLPLYANTHSGTSYCSRQTTLYREEARDIIKYAVNASDDDCILFAGNGCTGAVHQLIHILDCKGSSLVVFVGPFEHHSNLLPWRETGAEVVWIKEDDNGLLDVKDLEDKLKIYSSQSDKEIVCAFSASSNLTGVQTDTHSISCLVHQYRALVFWDYASSAPYVAIDMNPLLLSDQALLAYKDAVYFSMHKFVGGVDSPGVLVAKKHLFRNRSPHQCGGGTVFFVTPDGHRYFKTIEMREEGGTPNIIGSIRAGLAMQLKQNIGIDFITTRELEISNYVYDHLKDIPEIFILGPSPKEVPRLPIFSLVLFHIASGKYLHYNFVCSLLSDLFGIQARGGCSCAGPYAQRLLGIEELADRYEAIIVHDSRLQLPHMKKTHEFSQREVLRPGMTRLSFPYFMSYDVIDYIIEAIKIVAFHGWKLLPQETIEMAKEIFHAAGVKKILSDQSLFLSDEAETLRWFLLPSEAQEHLTSKVPPIATPPPFTPKRYTAKPPPQSVRETEEVVQISEKAAVFHNPPRSIFKLAKAAIQHYGMIEDGDKVLVCLSGGKDSLSLLHTLKQYQYMAKFLNINFELGAVTIDPKSSAYNPRPLIPYLASLNIPYFYEEQDIMNHAASLPKLNSICSFCSRMKRGRLYACARREGYNVLALGHHLDDLAESFLIAAFYNGYLRTMKANYVIRKGDLRVIRPFVYVREKELDRFAKQFLPVIPDNCPACFAAPKERERMKQLLAAQELMFPHLFDSLCSAIKPLMAEKLICEDEDVDTD